MKKQPEHNYELLPDQSMEWEHNTLYRIRAIKDIPASGIAKGDLGGYVKGYDNLKDEAWVYDEAKVYGNAVVKDNACVYSRAIVQGNTVVGGNVWVDNEARIGGDAVVSDYARIADNAFVSGDAHVKDYAMVYNHGCVGSSCTLSGNACVFDYVCVGGNAKITGHAHICGHNTFVGCNAVVRGHAKVDNGAYIAADIIVKDTDYIILYYDHHDITITKAHMTIDCRTHTKAEWFSFTDKQVRNVLNKGGVRWWHKWKSKLEVLCSR